MTGQVVLSEYGQQVTVLSESTLIHGLAAEVPSGQVRFMSISVQCTHGRLQVRAVRVVLRHCHANSLVSFCISALVIRF